jgi:hypothetical protein
MVLKMLEWTFWLCLYYSLDLFSLIRWNKGRSFADILNLILLAILSRWCWGLSAFHLGRKRAAVATILAVLGSLIGASLFGDPFHPEGQNRVWVAVVAILAATHLYIRHWRRRTLHH